MIYVILGFLVAFLLVGDPVIDAIHNGGTVGPKTTVGSDGIIRVPPAELAAAAGLDTETYSLARMMASEHGQDPSAYLIAVGWCVRNKADEKGVSILALVTEGKGSGGDGYYGRQGAAAGAKYCATSVDPRARHVEAAAQVLSAVVDPTNGATHFFSPATQDVLFDRGRAGKDAATVIASWTAPYGLYPAGAQAVEFPDVDPSRLLLFRRVG